MSKTQQLACSSLRSHVRVPDQDQEHVHQRATGYSLQAYCPLLPSWPVNDERYSRLASLQAYSEKLRYKTNIPPRPNHRALLAQIVMVFPSTFSSNLACCFSSSPILLLSCSPDISDHAHCCVVPTIMQAFD